MAKIYNVVLHVQVQQEIEKERKKIQIKSSESVNNGKNMVLSLLTTLQH